jgi:arsenate reductase (glutaredoxin)
MAELVVYEEPTCTTCRKLFTLLAERGIDADRVDYHVTGLTQAEIRELLAEAGAGPRDVLRSEPAYAEHVAG